MEGSKQKTALFLYSTLTEIPQGLHAAVAQLAGVMVGGESGVVRR